MRRQHEVPIKDVVCSIMPKLLDVARRSGLFSVLSYLVDQQAKEIGVRMALGATTKNV